jgi:hypothetical protein
MKMISLLWCAFAFLLAGVKAQSTANVYVEDSVNYGSAYGFLSTSFVGLKLSGGSSSITFIPGDNAIGVYVISMSDQSQTAVFDWGGPSYTLYITQTGKYWVYLTQDGTLDSYDWLEIRVESSSYSGTPPCYYCSPFYNWYYSWPPVGVPQVQTTPVATQPGVFVPRSSTAHLTKWLIPVLVVSIALAILIPATYLLYKRRRNNAQKLQQEQQQADLVTTATSI